MQHHSARKKRTDRPKGASPSRYSTPIFVSMLQDTRMECTLSCEMPQEANTCNNVGQFLYGILNLLPDGIMLYDQNGNLVHMNTLVSSWFDDSTDIFTQPIDQRVAHFAPTDLEGRPMALEEIVLSRLLHDETCTHLENIDMLLHLPDGHNLQLSVSGIRLCDQQQRVSGAILVLRDMTERYLLERRLLEAERQAQEQATQLEAILEALPDALYVYDNTGGIIRTNTAGRRSTEHFQLSDIASGPMEERSKRLTVCTEQGRPLPLEEWPNKRVLQGEILTPNDAVDVMMLDPQGQEFFFSASGGPLYNAQGDQFGAVFLMHNITRRKQTEQALQEQTRLLQEAKRQAQEQTKQLEAILEAVPDFLTVYDREGHVVRSNTASRRFLERFNLADITTVPVKERSSQAIAYNEKGEVLPPEDWPARRILQGETFTYDDALDLMYYDSQGQALFINLSGAPLYDVQGQCCGGVILAHDVTERKRIEQQLQEQARRLQMQADLIDLVHDAIFVRDPQARVISWNQGAEHLYGWSPDEAYGQVAHTLLQTIFPCPLDMLMNQLKQGARWEGTLTHTRRDGTQVVVESRWAMVRDDRGQLTALLEINRDITERLRLESLQQQLYAETEARQVLLQTILDALPNSVFLVRGSAARLVLANQATTAMWGASWLEDQPMEEFLQDHDLQVETSDETERFAPLQVLQEGTMVLQQQSVIHATHQREIPILVNAVPFDLGHLYPNSKQLEYLENQEVEADNRAALVVFQDVSTLKEAELLKDEFLSLAAHELRTPLTVLSSYIQLLQKNLSKAGLLTGRAGDMFKSIERARQQLLELTKLMLDVTHLQAGRMEIFPQSLDLLEMVQEISVRLQATTTKHQLVLHSTLEHLIISADPARMEQVLSNLIGNAIKYSPHGGTINVKVWEESHTGEALLSVQDQGIGIPPEQQQHLFERFVRGENTQGITGTGLGLYLSRTLVEIQGGRIWFESQEGEGSTFFLAFPLLTHEPQREA